MLSAGARVGPYEVLSLLGAGGMGEVYRARDTKLHREVALKTLPDEFARQPERLARLRQEARILASLNHPGIATLLGLEEADGGVPVLVMELVEGETLSDRLRRGALPLRESLNISHQIAQALEAAHQRGVLHRDLKPGNVRLTLEGRVKLLDFGLAKAVREAAVDSQVDTASTPQSEPGAVVGTAPYMSPEQARGEELDKRTDVWAFGCVLYEMLTGRRAFPGGTWAETVSALLTREPDWGLAPEATPAEVVRLLERCLKKDRERRLRDIGDVRLELEEWIAPRGRRGPRADEEAGPYPGLSPFTESEAKDFFGREGEVEALWVRLRARTLLAVIGPSGAGKTSFVRAGVVASRPEGWAAIVSTPGSSPMLMLGQALAPELAGDGEALRHLVRFEDPEEALGALLRWRKRHQGALLVVDQFEELFTLNPPEVQARFAALLGRVAGEADIHVLLSLRDDFLMRCQEQSALSGVFSDLTPLGPPSEAGLRRALVEPAARRGYQFEDDALVDEMLGAVEGERGALPLLAFAVARVWERRDVETRLLTRRAYEDIGGVTGALAQHAEATLGRVGGERQGLVREVFRNLVTAQGTRAVVERENLLSVFPSRQAAEQVLDKLVGARLLTTYEVADAAGVSPLDQVEIVHESLLTAWPRLVRWQAQDADGALLRDQLRQAAQLWHDRGRPDDLLWTGSSYREFALWSERYPGGLTATEGTFAQAATRLAGRRRRRRRIAVASVIAVLLAVIAAISVSRQQALASRQQALAAAHREEAAKLLALGRLTLEDHPTAALAYAIASLERSDTQDARRFALEALSRGGAAFVSFLDVQTVDFSPDGRWLATGGLNRGVRLWSREGGPPKILAEPEGVPRISFGPGSDSLVVGGEQTLRFLSIPDGKEIRNVDLEAPFWFLRRGTRVLTFAKTANGRTVRSWPLGGGEAELVGVWDDRDVSDFDVSRSGEWVAYARDRTIYRRPLDNLKTAPPRILGQHPAKIVWLSFETDSDRLVSLDEAGEIRIWPIGGGRREPDRTIHAKAGMNILGMDAGGSTLVAAQLGDHTPPVVAFVWDLSGPPDADPLVLRNGDATFSGRISIDRRGLWLATAHNDFVVLWALNRSEPRVIRAQPRIEVGFTPDGKWLVSSSSGDGTVRLWPLSPAVGPRHRILLEEKEEIVGLAMDPSGRHLLGTTRQAGRAFLIPLDGGKPRVLPRFSSAWLQGSAFSADGRLAAVGTRQGPKGNLIELWDLDSWKVRALDPRVGDERCGWGREFVGAVWSTGFTSDGRLLTAGVTGLRLWDLRKGTNTLLRPCRTNAVPFLAASSVDRFLLAEVEQKQRNAVVSFHDLRTNSSRELTSHGSRVNAVALDPTGKVAVTGDFDGVVRVGPVTGEEPHLLYGHRLIVRSVAVSPDGRWIASGSQDGTIRLWPMPEGRPFHTLPYEEILARLRSFTNLRVVPDAASAEGYRLEAGPFPGWKTVPRW